MQKVTTTTKHFILNSLSTKMLHVKTRYVMQTPKTKCRAHMAKQQEAAPHWHMGLKCNKRRLRNVEHTTLPYHLLTLQDNQSTREAAGSEDMHAMVCIHNWSAQHLVAGSTVFTCRSGTIVIN